MSKKCSDPKKSCRERESSRSSKPQGSSSKRNPSKCHRKCSRHRESSSITSEKSKQSCIARTEHLEPENSKNESPVSRSHNKRGRKICREATNNDKKPKKRKRKKKCGSVKKRKLSGSSECPRLIENLIKSCFCLKGFGSSSSSTSPYAVTSSCCCKCRFCRPDWDSKSIQCNDCDRFVTASLRAFQEDADKFCDTGNTGSADLPIREIDKTFECDTRKKSTLACGKWENEFRLGVPKCQSEKKLDTSTCYGKNKSGTGIENTIVKSSTGSKDFRSCHCSPKSSSKDISVKATDDCYRQYKSSNRISPQQKNASKRRNQKNSSITHRSRCSDRSSSSQALLIMFDIVFWPHTCCSQ